MKLRQLSILVPIRGALADPDALIGVLHRYVKQPPTAFDQQLLIDVVDYRHVPDGPGILLVAAEGFYSVSERGLRFSAKRDREAPAAVKLAAATSRTLAVATLLSAEPELSCDLLADTLEIAVGDRAIAIESDALAALAESALAEHFGAAVTARALEGDPRGFVAAKARIS